MSHISSQVTVAKVSGDNKTLSVALTVAKRLELDQAVPVRNLIYSPPNDLLICCDELNSIHTMPNITGLPLPQPRQSVADVRSTCYVLQFADV